MYKNSLYDIPILTTKKIYWKGVVGELLWILKGDTNIKYLIDNDIHIWDKDAYNYYKKLMSKANPSISLFSMEHFLIEVAKKKKSHYIPNYTYGDLGNVYGAQLRNFNGEVDQLKELIDILKNNPRATKKTVTFWNPSDTDVALTPCHWSFEILVEQLSLEHRKEIFLKTKTSSFCSQFRKLNLSAQKIYMNKNNFPIYGISLKWNQHSVDVFLGLPFNLASYGLLLQIIGKMVNMIPLRLIGNLSNVHIYEPHIEAVREQLKNNDNKHSDYTVGFAYLNSFFKDMAKDLSLLNSLEIDDFISFGKCYGSIKAPMLPYNK